MKSILFPKKKNALSKIKLDTKITKRHLPYESFQKLKVKNDFNVFIVFSDTKEEITIEANDNLHEHIKYAYEDGTLSLKKASILNVKGEETLNVFITTKPFYKFVAADDCTITLESLLIGENISVKLNDDCKFTSKIDVGNIDVTAKDDSEVVITGTANRLDLRLVEDSECMNLDLSVNHLEAHLSGDSTAKITVQKSINIKLKSDSTFEYKGNPDVEKKEVSGGSKFENIPS